ncbi:YecR family lipoprotein [Vibrio rhodolitus]|uniref:YecR family lipoprotein n=1 Tax=Vibrio rhodolitus TaxID=2231649 RepID=UPI000E0CB0E5|nr:YecR family lipoprotein [Vibrio rhodolitus]
MRFKLTVALLAAATLAGCANPVNKEWFVTDGSKSDAVITIAYDEGLLQQAVVDEQQALDMAIDGCRAWGFKSAQSLGIPLDHCARKDKLLGCVNTRYTQIYQCTN